MSDSLRSKTSTRHIVITGPESTGKTTLANFLSKKYNACLIPEVARDFLSQLGRLYTQHDVLHMASLQFQAQLNQAHCELVFSDTSLLNYLIWMEVKYGFVYSQIEEWFYLQNIDAYLLMAPDLAWELDPLRENQSMLQELFDLYLERIQTLNVPFFIIRGQDNVRNINAVHAVEQLIIT